MPHKHSSHIHAGKSRFLTETIGDYTNESFPKHHSINPDELEGRIDHYIHRKVTPQQPGLIACVGLPGVGKSSSIPKIQQDVQNALGFKKPQEHIIYKQPDGMVFEIGGYICERSNAIITLFHADNFFRALGDERKVDMLQDIYSCRKLWGNPRAALRFIRDIYKGKETDVRIYTGSSDEKRIKQPLGSIELRFHPENETTKIVIAEGVNVGEWSDRIKKLTHIKTLKILYNTSFEDSLIRVLRRDHDRKGYSFHEILGTRLLEYYYILELYMTPALRDEKTVLFNRVRDIPPFTNQEIHNIIHALKSARDFYTDIHSRLTSEQKQFIYTLSTNVIDRFQDIKGISIEELNQWRIQKLLKKEASKVRQIKNISR